VFDGDEFVALLRASTNAMCRLTSSSWAIISLRSLCLYVSSCVTSLPLHTVAVLVLSEYAAYLLHLGGREVVGIDPQTPMPSRAPSA